MMNVVVSRFVIVLLCVCGRYDLAWAHSSRTACSFHNYGVNARGLGRWPFYTRLCFSHKIQLSAMWPACLKRPVVVVSAAIAAVFVL
jgi:hypothetical protein